MKKLIAFLLTLALLAGFIACTSGSGDGKTTTDNKQAPVTTGTAGDKTDTSGAESSGITTEGKEEIPVIRYDGASFRVSTDIGADDQYFTDSDSDDPIRSALWKRNAYVQDTYDVVIEPVYTNGVGVQGQVDEIVATVLTDMDSYDLCSTMIVASGSLLSWGIIYDWLDMEYTNLDADYWLSGINDSITVDGHLFCACGATNVYALRYTYAMMYNRTMGDSYHFTEDIISSVDSGDWTIDYMTSLAHQLNGDPNYGFVAESLTNLDVYTAAFDIPIISDTENGLKLVLDENRMITAIDKVLALYWNDTGSLIYGIEDPFAPAAIFRNGNALFSTLCLDYCFNGIRDMEDDYTPLPYPKLDENQKEYHTTMMDNYHLMSIPQTADPEFASLITEVLNMKAAELMTPVYYEQSLQTKFVRDEDTARMLDLLMAGRTTDVATLVSINLSGASMMLREVVCFRENVFKSYYDEKRPAMEAALESLMVKIRDNIAKNGQ